MSVASTHRDAKVCLEESQAGELASFVQENLEAVQLAGELTRQEMQAALELVRGVQGQVHPAHCTVTQLRPP